MFCSQCGVQVDDSARFCPKCGAQLQGGRPAPMPMPVQPAAQVSSMPSASAREVPTPGAFQQAPAPMAGEGAGKTNKAKRVAIIAAAAVVVIALVVIFFVVKPFGQDGAPGAATPPTESSGPVDGSETSQDQQAPEEPVITHDEAFAQVLQDHLVEYGPAKLKKLSDQVTALDGTALATLYDFNRDGTDELLLAYYDPSKDTMTGSLRANEAYRVEVWAYDGKEAVLAHEQLAENSNGGELYVTLIENIGDAKDSMPALLQTIEYPNGSIFDTLITYYGFDGKSFVPVKSYEVIALEAGGPDSVTYKIDGKEVNKETYEKQAPQKVLTGDTTPYKLVEFNSSDTSWGYGVEDVKELTEETIDELGAISGADVPSSDGVNANALADAAFSGFPRDFVFSSGAGGWSTQITVQKDGTFTGQWMDSDMGDRGGDYPNGTVHACEFEGKFSVVDQVSDTEFELQLDYLRPTHAAEEKIEDGIRYLWADDVPYGLGEMTEKPVGGWFLYMPGAPNEGFPDEVTLWWRTEGWDKDAATLNGYGLVGSDSGNGSTAAWFSRSTS